MLSAAAAAPGARIASARSATIANSSIRPVPVSRMEANSRPGGTVRSACSGGGGVSSAMP